MMPYVVFVGQNPAKEENVEFPFHGTKSGEILLRWINILNIDKFALVNMANNLGKPQVEDEDLQRVRGLALTIKDSRIVALGYYSSSHLAKMGLDHFRLPHPSGLNRQLNDKQYVETVLRECRLWLERK